MQYTFYTADVFTSQIFNGAQIAVFPDAEGLEKHQMMAIARELNLSETVFIFKGDDSPDRRRIRIFSPHGEIDFGGHPTIAAAYILAHKGEIELKDPYTPIVLEQNTGPIDVNISQNKGQPVFVQFSLQVEPIVDRFVPTEHELASFLSIDEREIERKQYTARLVSCGYPYLVVPVRSFEAVRNAKFDFAQWSQSSAPQSAAQEILLFSNKTKVQNSDFHARLLGPDIGVGEDPPVGSALPAFSSYLCSHENLRKGTYTFAVDRGDERSRQSVLNLEMDHKGKDRLTVRIGGEAVMVSEGVMTIPEDS